MDSANENKPHSDHEYSEICQQKQSKLQRFGTLHSPRETKAREPTLLVEEVGGYPHNMAEILPAEEVFKEGRLRLSKSRIAETQNEIENLHAIDYDLRHKYREIIDSLRNDLLNNEKECKRLQEQIEWVSRRRAELHDEVRRSQRLYGDAAVKLATNLAELQRGRESRVTDKPQIQNSFDSLLLRKEPHFPNSSPVASVIIKSSPTTTHNPFTHFSESH
ncbi:unnamed protein product [Parnassius apollo]|uniref:(apollo) hypothetical protein n=1 Tax=Parnassius apollo TaxID=110799 RepID=A0A8S3XDL3_PARAO|nr:unnamed protein product [Parnassius apollo]